MTPHTKHLYILGLLGFVYRLFIIAVHVLFVWAVTGKPRLLFSLGWGAVNLGCYYIFHYFVLRHFKFGRDEKEITK